MAQTPSNTTPEHSSDAVVDTQRNIQRQQDDKDSEKSQKAGYESGEKAAKERPVQTSGVDQPAPPLPAQHLQKPGLEADMQLPPKFMAEGYKGSGKLEGMTALITGGDSGIGRAVAVLFARVGADVAIFYLIEHVDA